METILELARRSFYQVGLTWWLPGLIAAWVFAAAAWSIVKNMRTMLSGK